MANSHRLFAAVIVLSALSLFSGCRESFEDSDRKPGPPQEWMPTNAMEGSPSGRGISPGTGASTAVQGEPLVTVEDVTKQSNRQALIGRQVQWRNVPVQNVFNEQYLVVGSGGQEGVVVRLTEAMPGLKPGDSVNVSGMIAQLGEDLAHWQINQEQKDMIQRQRIFVNAFQAEKQ